MESAWEAEINFWDNPALNTAPIRNKRVHHRQAPGLNAKKQKPFIGHGTVLEGWLNGPCKIHNVEGATPTCPEAMCWSGTFCIMDFAGSAEPSLQYGSVPFRGFLLFGF